MPRSACILMAFCIHSAKHVIVWLCAGTCQQGFKQIYDSRSNLPFCCPWGYCLYDRDSTDIV